MSIESVNISSSLVQASQSSQSQQTTNATNIAAASAEKESAEKTEKASQKASVNEADFTKQLEEQIEQLNKMMQNSDRSLAFSVDKDLDEVVVKVVDTNTDEVIRQIPNEEALKFAKNLEGVLGVIFNDRA